MIKTLSFGIMHVSVAFTLVYLLTGDLLTGGLVALIEPCVNTVAYHFHEKLWSRRASTSAAEDVAVVTSSGCWIHAH